MNKVISALLTICLAFILTGCDFVKNALAYKDKTREFIESVLSEDYEKAVGFFALEHEMAKGTDVGQLKRGLVDFRKKIVGNFGDQLEYSFMKAEKKFSSIDEDSTPPNATIALIQFSNDKEFGVFKVLFDDMSGKILNINTLDVKKPIPSMTIFWLFGLMCLCVAVFNIYVIRQIKSSNRGRKWLKYIAVLFFNVPAITYAAVNGLSYDLLNFQIMLGVSFGYMGFLNSYWTFGIPLGGFYWLWRLRAAKQEFIAVAIPPDTTGHSSPTAEQSS